MMTMGVKKMLVLLAIAMFTVSSAHAVVWWGGLGDQTWNNPDCGWWQGFPPSASDEAGITGPAAYVKTPGAAALTTYVGWDAGGELNVDTGGELTTNLVIGTHNASNGVVNVNGGTINNAGRLNIGLFTGANGTLNMNAGVINSGEWLMVGAEGTGTLNMNGGVINIAAGLGLSPYNSSASYVNLNGGTITADNLWLNAGVIDIEAGTLILSGDQTMLISNLVSSGNLTAYDGAGTIVFDYGQTNSGVTTVAAVIPEPATMITLLGGLAGMFLKRKK